MIDSKDVDLVKVVGGFLLVVALAFSGFFFSSRQGALTQLHRQDVTLKQYQQQFNLSEMQFHSLTVQLERAMRDSDYYHHELLGMREQRDDNWQRLVSACEELHVRGHDNHACRVVIK